MADHNSTQQQRQTNPYNRNRSSRTQRRRTDKVDPSVYEIPIVESRSMLVPLYPSFINQFHQQLFAGGAMAGNPKIPMSAPAMLSTWTPPPSSTSTAHKETTRNTNKKKQKRTCQCNLLICIKKSSNNTLLQSLSKRMISIQSP